MRTTRRGGQRGLLAITGLGIGAAVAATSAIASADPFDPTNFAISIDGMTLIQLGTATATSASGGFAIADGAGSHATAIGGVGNTASAFGADSSAFVDRGNFDEAYASGMNSIAKAGFGDFDTALANTDSSAAIAGGTEAGLGSHDFASAVGPFTSALAVLGDFNVTDVFDPAGNMGSNAGASVGSGNFAYIVGDGDQADAGGIGSLLPGNDNVAEIVGNGDIAGAGSSVSVAGSNDFASILGSEVDAYATGGNFLVDLG